VHPSPLVDRALLSSRGFVVANAASGVAGMGFYAYLLTNVLWLQYIWDYDVFKTGLALVPGAVVAAVAAALLGPVAERRGHLVVVVPGALVWAGAYLWYALVVDPAPSFLAHWLPGQLLSGLGVGATLPILGSAAMASVPGGRYAVSSAVNTSVRQIGGVLGIAVLVVLIGTKLMPEPTTKADFAEGFRVIAFSASPGVFGVLAIIPFLGPLISFAISIWMLIIGVIAVKEVLDYSSIGKAIIVCLIAWVVYAIVLFMILTPLLLGGMAARSMMG
jgi:MFS family permease